MNNLNFEDLRKTIPDIEYNYQKIIANKTTADNYFMGIPIEVNPYMPDNVIVVVDRLGNIVQIIKIDKEIIKDGTK